MKTTSVFLEVGAKTYIEAKKNPIQTREKTQNMEEMETKDTAGGMRRTDAVLEKIAEMNTEIS